MMPIAVLQQADARRRYHAYVRQSICLYGLLRLRQLAARPRSQRVVQLGRKAFSLSPVALHCFQSRSIRWSILTYAWSTFWVPHSLQPAISLSGCFLPIDSGSISWPPRPNSERAASAETQIARGCAPFDCACFARSAQDDRVEKHRHPERSNVERHPCHPERSNVERHLVISSGAMSL